MVYYILIKRKGSKRWMGAIPAKKGASISKLKSSIKVGSKQFVYKLVNVSQLKRYIIGLKPRVMASKGMKRKRTMKRRMKGKKLSRRKVRKVKRRVVKKKR